MWKCRKIEIWNQWTKFMFLISSLLKNIKLPLLSISLLRKTFLISQIMLLLLLSCFSCVWLCNAIDSSPPGSLIPGILQARTLERVAISFSNAWKWKVKVKSFSCVWLLVTPRTAAYKAPPSMGFSRQEYWSGMPLPSPSFRKRHNKKSCHTEETRIERDTCTPMFIAALFIIARTWKQSLFSECWALSQLFHSPLLLSSRGFLVPLHFLP